MRGVSKKSLGYEGGVHRKGDAKYGRNARGYAKGESSGVAIQGPENEERKRGGKPT